MFAPATCLSCQYDMHCKTRMALEIMASSTSKMCFRLIIERMKGAQFLMKKIIISSWWMHLSFTIMWCGVWSVDWGVCMKWKDLSNQSGICILVFYITWTMCCYKKTEANTIRSSSPHCLCIVLNQNSSIKQLYNKQMELCISVSRRSRC
jgi:hypothetical protein